MIFSIGYQALTQAQLVALASRLHATVVDVRGGVRRAKKGFLVSELARALGPAYVWKGDVLGNKGGNCVREEGLAWLAAQTSNVLLLCLEEAPAECHRHSLIALPLASRGVRVHHVMGDEVVLAAELQAAIVEGRDYECDDDLDAVVAAGQAA